MGEKSEIDGEINTFERTLKAIKGVFETDYNIKAVEDRLRDKIGNEVVEKEKIYNWIDPNYNKFFSNKLNESDNLHYFEKNIDGAIKRNNDKIKPMENISGSRDSYNKFIKLLKDAQNTGDASEPRKKVRKQLLHNKNLLAFIYLSAILGGSYYIYRYLKK